MGQSVPFTSIINAGIVVGISVRIPAPMALSDTRIRNAKPSDKPYKLTDGGGLYLEVRPTGAKLWRYRYRIAGKENVFAINAYPAVSLSDARQARDSARKLVKQGIHPAQERKAERIR